MNVIAEKTESVLKALEDASLNYSLNISDSVETTLDSVLVRFSDGLLPNEKVRLQDEFTGWGPLKILESDFEINEIVINGPDSIWVERSGRIEKHSDRFHSQVTFKNFVERLLRDCNQLTNLDTPFANGKVGRFRVHIVCPPITPRISISLRAHNPNGWCFETLAGNGWASNEAINAVRTLITSKQNFIVVGPTGSGKTSLLNACLKNLDENERAVLIEDTEELLVPNSVSTRMLTRIDSQNILRPIDQMELVRQSLRMRPDRIIMGEIRGPEAKDLLMAFATGHQGCMGTLHAENARQALIRLEMLIQLGAPQWSLSAVRSLIMMSLQYIVVVGRKEGKRMLEGIYQLSSLEDFGFLIQKLH